LKKQVFVFHPNPDMILAIQDVLDEVGNAAGYDLSVSRAKTEKTAEQLALAGAPVDLLIAALETSPPTGVGELSARGLELVRKLRANKPGMAAILVTGQVNSEIFALMQSEGVSLATEGAGFSDRLKSEITRLLGPYRPDVPRRVDLEISLSTDKGCFYQFQPEGRPPETVGVLTVDPSRLTDWIEQSREVHVANHTFKGDLRRLSDALGEELFERSSTNLKFFRDLNRWVGKVGMQNIRVRFSLQDALFPIAVEALKPRTDEDYWMLETAVYRTQPHLDIREPELRGLFQDERTKEHPINVLIIQANVTHKVIVKSENLSLTLDRLDRLEEEVTAVTELLTKLKGKQQSIIGEVRVIDEDAVPAGNSFKKLVEEVLKEGPWHIVHYAGHAYYDFEHKIGYLFFPDGDGGLKPIRIDEFAWLLRKADTRFVFLSSCEGAQQDFVYHLAKERIPAIMGFLWNVGDARAGEYAKAFYQHLFGEKERALEYACLEAKKEMHHLHVDEPIWASPVLVMQVGV
jgi:CheY-like chemotaxis protein